MAEQPNKKTSEDHTTEDHHHEHHKHHKPSVHGLVDQLKPIHADEVEKEKAKERPFEDLSKQHKIHHLDDHKD